MNQDLNSLIERIEKLEKVVYNFEFMYKPPDHEEYINLVDYLNAVDRAIKQLNECVVALGNFVK
jgi:hypothetical protein